jgi:phage tail-like protein
LSTCWQTGGKIMDTGFKFQVRWDGRVVVGVTKVSALKRSTEVIEHREGGDPSTSRKSPGLTKFQPIVLKRGVTRDQEFENWANLVYLPQPGPLVGAEVSLKNFRKDIEIELLNEAGQMVSRYRVRRCWPSEYTAFPDLDANGTAVSVEQIVVENEGWERDTSVIAPQEE